MKKINLIHIILFLLSFSAYSQVNFNAELSKSTLGLNERVKIEFSVDKDGDNFIPPKFENFRIVGGPSQSIRNSWVNGKRSFSKTYAYFLSPIKKGAFQIGQASIEVDGDIYKTLPVKVTVTSAVDKPSDPNDPNYIADNNVHLVAEISDKNPFLNEAMSITYKLYFSSNTGIDISRELETPRYVNFWNNNIDIGSYKIQNGTFKGQPYSYVIIRKTVLYPQKIGQLKIEPLTLDVSVQVPSNRRDFFGNRILSSVNKTVSTGSSFINVRPLPIDGKPKDFSGAVGDFNFEIKSNKNKLIIDEAFQLNVIVSGRGNFNLYDEPKIALPNSLEVYEPEKISDISVRVTGIRGKVNNEYTVVPNRPGKYIVPETKFSFFNPELAEYKTIYSDPIYIDVEGNFNERDNDQSNNENNNNVNKIQLTKIQFSSFKTKTVFSEIDNYIFFNSKKYWVLLIIPFVLCIIILLISKIFHNYKSRKIDQIELSRKLTYKLLDDSRQFIGDKEKFYESIDRALSTYLKSKLNIKNSDFKNEEIKKKLETLGINKNAIIILFQVFENCQLARYTPLNINEMSDDFEKAKLFIEKAEKIKK